LLVGVTGLITLRVAYDLTQEPGLGVRVRWRDGTSTLRRVYLESKYRLVQPVAPQGLSYSYALLDARTSNIRALVTDPEVADTGDIDREKFDIPWVTAHESRRFTWVAERTPVLRQPFIRWTVIAALAWMIVSGSWSIGTRIRWRAIAHTIRRWLMWVELQMRDE